MGADDNGWRNVAAGYEDDRQSHPDDNFWFSFLSLLLPAY